MAQPEGPAPTGVSVEVADSDPAASAAPVIPSPRTAPDPPVVTPVRQRSWRDQRARFAALGAAVVTMVITAGIFFVNAGGTPERSHWLSPGPSGDAVLVDPGVTDPGPTRPRPRRRW